VNTNIGLFIAVLILGGLGIGLSVLTGNSTMVLFVVLPGAFILWLLTTDNDELRGRLHRALNRRALAQWVRISWYLPAVAVFCFTLFTVVPFVSTAVALSIAFLTGIVTGSFFALVMMLHWRRYRSALEGAVAGLEGEVVESSTIIRSSYLMADTKKRLIRSVNDEERVGPAAFGTFGERYYSVHTLQSAHNFGRRDYTTLITAYLPRAAMQTVTVQRWDNTKYVPGLRVFTGDNGFDEEFFLFSDMLPDEVEVLFNDTTKSIVRQLGLGPGVDQIRIFGRTVSLHLSAEPMKAEEIRSYLEGIIALTQQVEETLLQETEGKPTRRWR